MYSALTPRTSLAILINHCKPRLNNKLGRPLCQIQEPLEVDDLQHPPSQPAPSGRLIMTRHRYTRLVSGTKIRGLMHDSKIRAGLVMTETATHRIRVDETSMRNNRIAMGGYHSETNSHMWATCLFRPSNDEDSLLLLPQTQCPVKKFYRSRVPPYCS